MKALGRITTDGNPLWTISKGYRIKNFRRLEGGAE